MDSDEQLAESLRGKTITWVNGISTKSDKATVDGPVLVARSPAGRTLVQFLEHRGGYRAVYLDAITNIT